MIAKEFAPSFALIQRVFPEGTRENEVCAYVFERLDKLKEQLDSVTLATVANALGWEGDVDGKKAIAKALDYLTFGDVPLLERKFALWSADVSDEVLETPICELTDSDVRTALERQVLVVPTTGQSIKNFADQVTVFYLVTNFAHQLASHASKEKS
jgi:hypothetical protein